MTSNGETDLAKILKTLNPRLNSGEFVFCIVNNCASLKPEDIIMSFREEEGNTIIVKKEVADELDLPYSYVASWITLSVHSSLAAVGLTSAFSTALAKKGISCNVVAAFYHDHIFVDKKDAQSALEVLNQLSK